MQLQDPIIIHGIGPKVVSSWKQNMIYSQVSRFYVGKGYLCSQVSKCHHWKVNVYFTDQNIMQMGDT